jgi:CheY-like chemotaxis protein
VPTILVVDDEWAIADWLEAILSDVGYRVFVASNGLEALNVLENEEIQLVISDFMMPFVDAPALMRTMKAETRTANIPVIIITALQEQTVSQRLQGYRTVLRKPFRESELLEAVTNVLGPFGPD